MEKINLQGFYRIETEVFVELSRFEQKRKHKRPRINKKWRKRYGFINERFRIPYSQFEPKHFTKYQKRFFVDGRAIPQSNELRIPVLESPPVELFVFGNPPQESISYEVKTFQLQKIGCHLETAPQHIPLALEHVRFVLKDEIDKISKTIDLEPDILNADILE